MKLATIVFVCGACVAAASGFDEARKLYDLTDFEQSIGLLQKLPAKDGPAWELMGRDYYMLADYKKATDCMEKALAAEPQNGEIALWLGRAYGRRAETSSPFTAPGQASKARQYFERAVQLQPRNVEAMGDLFEYYMDAPGFLGGGLDKAQALASRMIEVDASEGHAAQARLAEKRKEFGTAEAHLREAINDSPQRIGRLIEMAHFLAKQGRFQEADQNLSRAEKIAPDSPRVVYAKADIYVRARRNLDVAQQLLKRYLSMSISPDDPPKTEAAKLLKQAQGT